MSVCDQAAVLRVAETVDAAYGAYTALTDGVGKAWVADLLPARAMGTGLGLFQGITGGCVLVASIWAGLAWNGDGRLPLQISGIAVAIIAGLLLTAGRHLDRPPRNTARA
jgi:hypothetical protein